MKIQVFLGFPVDLWSPADLWSPVDLCMFEKSNNFEMQFCLWSLALAPHKVNGMQKGYLNRAYRESYNNNPSLTGMAVPCSRLDGTDGVIF